MDDIRTQTAIMLQEIEQEELNKNRDLIHSFSKYCKKRDIILEAKNFHYIHTIGCYIEYPNILQSLSCLQPTKDGLFHENKLLNSFTKRPHITGFYYADAYMPMAHPLFRRNYNPINNFAPRFVERFWQLDLPGIDKCIALDSDRVRINVDNSVCIERDIWYGARFSTDIVQTRNGSTVLAPPPDIPDLYDNFFGEVLKLDIFWSESNDLKTFQAEELKKEYVTIELNGITYHPVRYIHAQYDLKKRTFCHMDGAIHLYLPKEFDLRKGNNLTFNRKNDKQIKPRSIKLFRIDGDIPVSVWSEFVSQFFTGDPQIYEYFAGHYPSHVTKVIDRIRSTRS